MRSIVVETSAGTGEVALAEGQQVIASARLSAGRKHARDLTPTLKRLLDETGWDFGSIQALFVDVGPGSYTGLRVGLATVMTIAYARKIDVVGVDAMSVLAEQSPTRETTIASVIDAQQGLVYAASFARSDSENVVRQVDQTQILSAADWAQGLREGVYVTGPALVRYRDLVPQGCKTASDEESIPRAATLAAVGSRRYQQGVRSDFWTLEPAYLRASSAELKWARRHEQE